MSIGSLGVIGSITTGQLQQGRQADGDRATQEARNASREAANARHAESAEGVGQMTQDEGTSDRDADGRRLWERPNGNPHSPSPAPPLDADGPHPLDPTGDAGGQLDLLG